jgi:hypothetical protein
MELPTNVAPGDRPAKQPQDTEATAEATADDTVEAALAALHGDDDPLDEREERVTIRPPAHRPPEGDAPDRRAIPVRSTR